MSDVIEQPAEPEVPEAAPVDTAAQEPEADAETAAELAGLEAAAVDMPDGDGVIKYVPLSAVTKPRKEARLAREEAKALKSELERLRNDWQQAQPYVDAAKALLQNPQPQPPATPQGPTREETAELEALARHYDFYNADGTPDLGRAMKTQELINTAAMKAAQTQVAPLQQQAQIAAAQAVLNDVRNWEDPVTKEKADSALLTNLWNRVAQQPNGLQTLANKEAAMFIWSQAVNLTRWQKAQQGGGQPAPAAPPSPPVFVESAGGNTSPGVTLSSMERKAAKDMGMSEAEYLKAAQRAPRGM